jgi:hypothetical protein
VSLSHLDRLAESGFNRALVKFIADSLGAEGERKLRAWTNQAARVGIELAPRRLLEGARPGEPVNHACPAPRPGR